MGVHRPPGNSRVPTAYELYIQAQSYAEVAELEDGFFDSLWIRHGTSKTTYRGRLGDLDEFVAGLLPRDRSLDVMDVAISSGVSTVEWMRCLENAGIQARMVAGDAVVNACLFSLGGVLHLLSDDTGYLMQLGLGRRAVAIPPRKRFTRKLYFAPALLANWCARLFDRRILEGAREAGATMRKAGVECRPLKLVSRALLEQGSAEVVQDDILRDRIYQRSFDVLRAANILNLNYFDTPTLGRMLANLRERLRPQGLLIVCRTVPAGRNDASVFRLSGDGRFEAVARLNEGSEITELVLNLPPQSAK